MSWRSLALAGVLVLAAPFVMAACSGKSGSSTPTAQPTAVADTPTRAPTATATPSPTATAIPAPALKLSTTQVYQAGAVLVTVTGPVASGTATFLDRDYPLTKDAQGMTTFTGVDTDDPTGDQPLTVNFKQNDGTPGKLTATVTVLHTQWTVDSLTFDSTTSELLDPTIVNNEYALLNSIYTKVTPLQYWSGSWIVPVDGPLTSRYGEQRSINGGPPSGHHGGTDIGVPEGTPVKAANAGKVVLARKLNVRGNMVIIDHGGGLYTGYAHLSQFDVTEGEMVKQGDLLALSGQTGLDTGPHLHWEMNIDAVFLDALRFTDGTNGLP
jgi:murein DD-endopeptidase MepM/ murein hydrolase activator NlpD